MARENGNPKPVTKYVAPLLWLIGCVIAGLSIAGIAESQSITAHHFFIIILVLSLFAGTVALLNCLMSRKSQKAYDVNEAKDAEKGGRDNKAYNADETKKSAAVNGAASTSGGDQKWVNNYVPYGDYPKGNVVYVKEYFPEEIVGELNGAPVEIVSGEEEPTWQKNYVAYQ